MNSPPHTVSIPDGYRLHMRLVDYEHNQLFALIRRLDDPRADSRWVLAELTDYALKHFLVEEELMNAYDYPHADTHKAAHDLFRSRVGEMMADLDDSGEVLKAIRVFLERWLVNHIDILDRQLVKWILDHP